jgi:hypothetical protein
MVVHLDERVLVGINKFHKKTLSFKVYKMRDSSIKLGFKQVKNRYLKHTLQHILCLFKAN